MTNTVDVQPAAAYRDAVRGIFATATAELQVAADRIFNDAFERLDALSDQQLDDPADGTRVLRLLGNRRRELTATSQQLDAVIKRLDPNTAPWP
jgi:hypothetical protein